MNYLCTRQKVRCGILLEIMFLMMSGCTFNVPGPFPLRTTTYELNRDSQKWSRQDCTIRHINGDKSETKFHTVCYKETLESPPSEALEPGK